MDWRIVLYMALALAYLGFPLYLLMGPAHAGSKRVLALGLLVYGLAGLFWPGLENGFVLFLSGGSAIAGLALLFRAAPGQLPWMLVMAYCLAVMASPEVSEPGFVLAAAIVFTAGLERTFRPRIAAAESAG